MNCLTVNKLINVPFIAAHLEKRAGKQESFEIIKRSINGEILTENDWAVLYSYFMPPKPKKITNVFEWVSFVCDDKESYSFCKFLYVKDNKIMAANTKTAHIAYSDLGLENNMWYDIQKGRAGDDVAIMPNINDAVKEASINDYEFDKTLFENGLFDIVDTPTGLSYVLPWNKKGVNKQYLDIIIKSLDDISIMYSSDGPFIVNGCLKGIKCSSVIMPFKLHGILYEKVDVETENTKMENENEENYEIENAQMSF